MKYNTDAIRAFIGTVAQTWLPIIVALHIIDLDAATLGAIEAGIVATVNAAYLIFKPNTPA